MSLRLIFSWGHASIVLSKQNNALWNRQFNINCPQSFPSNVIAATRLHKMPLFIVCLCCLLRCHNFVWSRDDIDVHSCTSSKTDCHLPPESFRTRWYLPVSNSKRCCMWLAGVMPVVTKRSYRLAGTMLTSVLYMTTT